MDRRAVPGVVVAVLGGAVLVTAVLSYPQPTQPAYEIHVAGQPEPPLDGSDFTARYDFAELPPRAQSVVERAIRSDDGDVVVYGSDAVPAMFRASGVVLSYAIRYDGQWYEIHASGPPGIGGRTDEFRMLVLIAIALLIGGYAAFERPAPRRAGGTAGLVLAVAAGLELDWEPFLRTIPDLLGPDTNSYLAGLFLLSFVASGVVAGEWCRRTAEGGSDG